MDLKGDIEKQCNEHSTPDHVPTHRENDSHDGEKASDNARKPWLIRQVRWLSKSRKPAPSSSPKAKTVDDPYAVKTTSLEDIPRGYPQVATFLSSDRNFLQFRVFGNLHCRALSDMQYDLGRLETELYQLDKWDYDSGNERKLACKHRDVDKTPDQMAAEGYPEHLRRSRPKVLTEVRQMLKEYDKLLLKTKEVMSLPKPSDRDYESVRVFFKQNPLVQNDGKFVTRKEDIVTLRTGRETSGFDSFVERCLTQLDRFLCRWLRCRIVENIFRTPQLREKTSLSSVRYYAPGRVDKLVNILITIVVFILLVLPVIVMYEVTELGARQSPLDAIGVLIVFTLIFGMAISLLTTARRHELFGASAAYAAVLVVFIGNFGVQQVEILPQKKPW